MNDVTTEEICEDPHAAYHARRRAFFQNMNALMRLTAKDIGPAEGIELLRDYVLTNGIAR